MNKDAAVFNKIRPYFMIAAIMIATPSLLNLYSGHTGRLLVATQKLDDDRFFNKTVIYLFDHSFWGAKGIIVNRPMLTKDPEKFGVSQTNAILYNGGPVAYPRLKTVALDKPKTASRWGVQPLSVVDYKGFERRYPNYIDEHEPLNVYIGYSGWDLGQLENEIERGLWTVLECNINQVSREVQNSELWQKLTEIPEKICAPKK